jgi:hypothetical protein
VAADIDNFATALLEEAKRFLEKAIEGGQGEAQTAFLHAAMMVGFASLEAHVNAVADEFSQLPTLTIHDKAVLQEKEVRLEHGQYKLKHNVAKFYRLEDRFLFLHERFSGAPLDRKTLWWSQLSEAIELRNSLTHPKTVPHMTVQDVDRALTAVIDCIDALYKGVYRKGFPARNMGLHSTLNF